MPSADNRIDRRDWGLLGLLSVLWGGSFFFNGVILRELPPLTLVLLRVALGTIMLLPLLRARKIEFPRGVSGWAPFFAMGLFNNVLPFSLIVFGQTYIPSGLASILNATTPLFAVVIMAVTGDERLQARRVAGVTVGLIGVAILHGDALGFESRQGIGIALCLAGAFSYGIAALVGRRLPQRVPPLGTAAFQMMASSVMMAPVAAVADKPWLLPMPHATTWLAVLGLAALSTALAYIVFFQILQRSGATNVMLVTLLIPVTAMLLGYLVLGEPVSWREVTGALVIASALLLIDGRVLSWFSRAPASTPHTSR
ncbi:MULTISPECIES: DMT family transporter [Bradyrhizobium]|jgi:drug/metabolite transporter (DMT)-like permease|uniref:DMT family transporter n=1 Tax=Bradyrhizobium TaxID=374 RepID=UPI0003F6E98B|nr:MULTISPECIES: DMT family transporter [Bradyrhizobium]KIU47968.1 ABC transporter permease [Bradyrhizobium elkanii]MBK5654955.1 DMT family transporter [Rhizobium sp.]OCX26897.1 ABC transporter permease [Bradyrhizobium sp. UASWS1016]